MGFGGRAISVKIELLFSFIAFACITMSLNDVGYPSPRPGQRGEEFHPRWTVEVDDLIFRRT